MCGRYSIFSDPDTWRETFHVDLVNFDHTPRYNAAPNQFLPVITNAEPRTVSLLRWGIMPVWAKPGQPVKQLINARGESVGEKPAFRAAFTKRRCLVVADGFYEWQATDAGKVPHHITLKRGGPFAFAGIWEPHHGAADGEQAPTFAIITTEPNELMAPIHNRMPVILNDADVDRWLSDELPVDEAVSLLRPYPTEHMTAYPVSSKVNSPRFDTAELITPVMPPDAAATLDV